MSPRLGPCKRADFIFALRSFGFEGPFRGTRHEFMQYGDYPLHIPSYNEYSVDMLTGMPREVGGRMGHRISSQYWANLQRGRTPERNVWSGICCFLCRMKGTPLHDSGTGTRRT